MRPVFLPERLDDLWDALDGDPTPVVYAGGTDLLVAVRAGRVKARALVCLERISDLRGVTETADSVRIGACTTHQEVLDSASVAQHVPVLRKAVSVLAGLAIRHMGTIGGNIVTASPAGDTIPPLYLHDATIEIASRSESRQARIHEFIRGPGQVDLRPGEIVSAIQVAKAGRFNLCHHEKVGKRKAMACAVASFACLLRVTASGTIEEARLAFGSVAPTVLRPPAIERALEGRSLTVPELTEIAEQVEHEVSPIDDVRAGAAYRRVLAGRLLLRLAAIRHP